MYHIIFIHLKHDWASMGSTGPEVKSPAQYSSQKALALSYENDRR